MHKLAHFTAIAKACKKNNFEYIAKNQHHSPQKTMKTKANGLIWSCKQQKNPFPHHVMQAIFCIALVWWRGFFGCFSYFFLRNLLRKRTLLFTMRFRASSERVNLIFAQSVVDKFPDIFIVDKLFVSWYCWPTSTERTFPRQRTATPTQWGVWYPPQLTALKCIAL